MKNTTTTNGNNGAAVKLAARAPAYAWHRKRGKPAAVALAAAVADGVDGVARHYYASTATGWQCGATSADGLRWFEDPAAAGLRFVGYADQLARVGHTGHYVRDDGGEVARGVVYAMPARHGRPLYLAGYACPYNAGAACLDVLDIMRGAAGGNDDDDTKRAAAYAADHIADRAATNDRAHDSAWQAGARFADIRERAAALRADIRAALLALRPQRRGPLLALPAVLCERLRADIRADLATLDRLRRDARTLADIYGPAGYHGADLAATFNDGAAQ